MKRLSKKVYAIEIKGLGKSSAIRLGFYETKKDAEDQFKYFKHLLTTDEVILYKLNTDDLRVVRHYNPTKKVKS